MKKHITEYEGGSFYGFRVAMQKRGITFFKYFSSTKLGRDEALRQAIAFEQELSSRISGCDYQQLLDLHKNFH